MLEIIIFVVIILVAFIGASWYSHQRSQERARAFEKELDFNDDGDDDSFQERFDALFDQEVSKQTASSTDEVEHLDTDAEDAASEAQPELFDAVPTVEPQQTQTAVEEPDSIQDWDMVIALTIMAPDNAMFEGRAVKAALDSHNLHFGEMQIYHRTTNGLRRQSLFSVANILDPGTLLPDTFISMRTPGLLMFARLPAPINGMALFDDLLATARSMTEQLGGVLCDDRRQPVSDSALEEMRGRILEYQMAVQVEERQNSNDYFD